MQRYFPKLLVSTAASLALIVADAMWKSSPALFAVAPVLPLVAYHLLFLRPKMRELGSAEIDSVYYFGFLITVAALGVTAFEIAGSRGGNLQPVLTKFGVGLLATGYAVLARLHLQSLASISTVSSPEQALDHYVKQSGELLDNMHTAIVSVRDLANAASHETQRVIDEARSRLEQVAQANANTFNRELTATLSATRESIAAAHALLVDTSFVEEREQLRAELRASVEMSRETAAALQALAGGARSSAESLAQTKESSAALGASAELLSVSLGRLITEQASLTGVAANVQAASQASALAAKSAADTAAAVLDLSAQVSQVSPALNSATHAARDTSQQLESLSEASRRLVAAVDSLTAAIEASDRFASRIDAVGQALPELAGKAQALGGQFDSLKGTLNATAGRLEGDVERSTKAVGMLADNLTGIAQTIIERTRERHARV